MPGDLHGGIAGEAVRAFHNHHADAVALNPLQVGSQLVTSNSLPVASYSTPAMVQVVAATSCFIGAAFQADGAYAAGWGIIAGGTFEPANVDAVKDHRTMMRREAGNYPASVNEDNWPRLFRRLSSECGFTADEVDQLIFTQISKPSIAIAAERCKVPIEKCHTIMEKYGYTGTACIPMALDDAIELGKIKRGDLVVMISSGLGWNQVAAAVRMTM